MLVYNIGISSDIYTHFLQNVKYLVLNKIYFSLISFYQNRRDSNKIFWPGYDFKEKITFIYEMLIVFIFVLV